MKNVGAIYRKELKGYFSSPVAYIVTIFFLVIVGVFFFFLTNFFLMGMADMRAFFFWLPLLFVLFVPAMTMRLLAEERKSGTMELLITLPLRESEVVLGKYLAAFTLLAVMLASTLTYPLSVSLVGDLDWGPVIGGYLGLLLLGGAYLSLGTLASTWASNQIVAFIVGLVLCASFYLIDKFIFVMPETLAPFFEYLSLDYHFKNISRGVIDTRDLVYYGSAITAALAMSVEFLESRSWS